MAGLISNKRNVKSPVSNFKSIPLHQIKNYFPMKRISIIAAGILMIAASSCTKDELRSEQEFTEPVVEVTATATPVATVSEWQPVREWSVAQESKSQAGTISNAAITTDVVDNGLVLVFAKKGDVAQSLPYTDGDIYWNYQVEAGQVSINAAATTEAGKIDRQQAFQYIVLSKEQVDALETKGVSRDQLINMSYLQAIALTK
jgi:hypothetical protein